MRHGASMLELVVAIVVMGIAVMALPLMLSQTKSNNEFAMQQEAILAARTKLGDVMTYAWDEANVALTGATLVLDTNDTGSDIELNKVNGSRRIGHIFSDKRRKGYDIQALSTASGTLGADVGETQLSDYDDIDDFHNTSQQLFNSGEATIVGQDYKFTDMNLTTRITYIDDSATYINDSINDFIFTTGNANRRSNIKMVEITVSGSQTNFVLRSYSSNIGESELLRRTW